ncbi:hypothetical protein FRC02_005993, partial [Tulasnella sp. 418]
MPSTGVPSTNSEFQSVLVTTHRSISHINRHVSQSLFIILQPPATKVKRDKQPEKKSRRKTSCKKIVSLLGSSKTDVSIPLAVERVQSNQSESEQSTSSIESSSSSSNVATSEESVSQDGATTDTALTSPTPSQASPPDTPSIKSTVGPSIMECRTSIPFPLPGYSEEWYKLHAAPLKSMDPALPLLNRYRPKATRLQDALNYTEATSSVHTKPSSPKPVFSKMQVVIAGSSNTQGTPKIDQLGKESMAIPFPTEQVIDPKELAPSAHRNRIQTMTETRLDKSQVEVAKTKAHGRERRDGAGSKT